MLFSMLSCQMHHWQQCNAVQSWAVFLPGCSTGRQKLTSFLPNPHENYHTYPLIFWLAEMATVQCFAELQSFPACMTSRPSKTETFSKPQENCHILCSSLSPAEFCVAATAATVANSSSCFMSANKPGTFVSVPLYSAFKSYVKLHSKTTLASIQLYKWIN